ncbi:Cell division and transport-associated protein TolA [Magnetococcus marinus MC-1]|uniref:Cell division and transport-associated protein TolA n=1 Tax=Magnetococcus marinus (strain ATCC BAA-1437 / JCM 17883 / MC-1) TaxID=156889 RepID=A0L4V0_MAGMM|nr:energy transducer TonB [Magnetococcus marinus]ABK42993.1 Cell division and transport-associated protein TolA [Magnetococcus marinus MC-1]
MRRRGWLLLLFGLWPGLLHAAPSRQAIQQWGAELVAQVEANWLAPAGIDSHGLTVQLSIQWQSTGALIMHGIRRASGQRAFDESVVHAIEQSQNLPAPPVGCQICLKPITFNFAPGAKPQQPAQIRPRAISRSVPPPRAKAGSAPPPAQGDFSQAIDQMLKSQPTPQQLAQQQAEQQAWQAQLYPLWQQQWQPPAQVDTRTLWGQWRVGWNGKGGLQVLERLQSSGHGAVDAAIVQALQGITQLPTPPPHCTVCQQPMVMTFERGSLRKAAEQTAASELAAPSPPETPALPHWLGPSWHEDAKPMEPTLHKPYEPPPQPSSAVEKQREVAQWFQHVRHAISNQWQRPSGDIHVGRSMMLRVQWLENGTLEWVSTVRPSGHEGYDETVLKAVEAVAQLPPPPEGCTLCLRPIYITMHNEQP